MITDFSHGIRLYPDSNNNTFQNNSVNSNYIGFYFGNSNNNTLSGNQVCNSSSTDVYVSSGSGNTGSNNTCNTASNYKDVGNVDACTFSCTPTGCSCSSCFECTGALDNPLCSEVKLTTDILNYGATCINNPANFSNKIFDCQRHIIDGIDKFDLDYGIYLSGKSNNLIKNCVITDFSHGIRLYPDSNNNTFQNNSVNSNYIGFYFGNSNNNTLSGNQVCNSSSTDVYVLYGSGNTGSNNSCDKTSGWNDVGATSCTYSCPVPPTECNCSSCLECNAKLNNASCDIVFLNTSISNQTGTCINNPENFNNKIFDCQGYTIDGDDSEADYGILLNGKNNNVIENCVIHDFAYGIFLRENSDHNQLNNNTVNSNTDEGIIIQKSSYNNITGNMVNSNSKQGIDVVFYSYHNKIIDNIVKWNGIQGIRISDSSSNILNSNEVCGNTIVQFSGTSNSGDNNTCDTTFNWDDEGTTGCTYRCINCTCSNCSECEDKLNDVSCTTVFLDSEIINHPGTCIDNPENFNNKIFDCQWHVVDGNGTGYGVYINNRDNNTVRNCEISDFVYGIQLESSSNNLISNNNLSSNYQGIYLHGSQNNTLTKNYVITEHSNEFNLVTNGDMEMKGDERPLYWSNSWLSGGGTGTFNSLDAKEGVNALKYDTGSYSLSGDRFSNSKSIYLSRGSYTLSYWSKGSLSSCKLEVRHGTDVIYALPCSQNGTYTKNIGEFNVTTPGSHILEFVVSGLLNAGYFDLVELKGNEGYGIIITSSSNNIFTENVVNSHQNGIYFTSDSNNNNLNNNHICNNTDYDIYDMDANSGSNNTCDTTYHWNDINTTGCTYSCSTPPTESLHNTFTDNIIIDTDYGIYIKDKTGVNITNNRVYNSKIYDIFVVNSQQINGSNNTCETTYNYSDNGANGCAHQPIQKCTSDNNCTGLSNQCNDGKCNLTTGACYKEIKTNGTSCSDGAWCNGNETCQSGVCTAGTPPACNDGQWCNGVETCNEANDSCDQGTPPNCNDNINCTVDSCNEGTVSCIHTPNDGLCSQDAWFDTGNTHWVSTGQCTEKQQKEQEYRNYYCHQTSGCQYTVTSTQWVDNGNTRNKADGTTCDDGQYCTNPDTCTAGTCGGTARNCSDGVACTDDTCDEGNNACVNTPNDSNCPADAWFDTGNTQWVSTGQCTEKQQKEQEYRNYYCHQTSGCQYTVTNTQWVDNGNTRNKADGTTCDDGQYCTNPDTCTAGVCGGTARNCSDGVACTDDSCNESNDQCLHTENNNNCSSNQICNATTHGCQNLSCSPGYYPQNHGCVLNTSYCFSDNNCSGNQICNTTIHACQNLNLYVGVIP